MPTIRVNGLAVNELGQGEAMRIFIRASEGRGLRIKGRFAHETRDAIKLAYALAHEYAFENGFQDFFRNNRLEVFIPPRWERTEGPSLGAGIFVGFTALSRGVRLQRLVCVTGAVASNGYIDAVGGNRQKMSDFRSREEFEPDEEELVDMEGGSVVMSLSPASSLSKSSESEIYSTDLEEEGTNPPAESDIFDVQQKRYVAKNIDSIIKLRRKLELNNVSAQVLDRAVDYMQLYLDRYSNRKFSADWIRRMLFFARMHGAPVSKIRFSNPIKQNHKPTDLLDPGFEVSWLCSAIDMEHFFDRMDYLEAKFGERLWELHFVYGYENLNSDEGEFFRWKIISTIRSLYKKIMKRKWAEVAQNIANIEFTVATQYNSKSYLSYLRINLSLHIPAIFLTALQCSLETKCAIDKMSDQFIEICSTFRRLPTPIVFPWMDNSLLFLSNVLIFHLVNLRVKRRSEGGGDFLSSYISEIRLHNNAEHHRVIMLLSFCLEAERNLMTTEQQKTSKSQVRHNNSQSILFANFLRTLFDDPKSSVGLFPLAVWGAIQFGSEEELVDYLFDACTKHPHLLVHFHNVLSRFRLEQISGRLFERLFDLSLGVLTTSPVLLEILEQRTLDPTAFGMFDSVVSQNLKALFMFLDFGRHRDDIRAWALFHSNLCYLSGNDELMMPFLQPLWSKRKDWWHRFHSVPLSSTESERMRKESLAILNRLKRHN